MKCGGSGKITVRKGPGPFSVLPRGRCVLVTHEDKASWRIVEEVVAVGDISFLDWHVCLTCNGGEPPPSYKICPSCKGSLAESYTRGKQYYNPPLPPYPKCDHCSGSITGKARCCCLSSDEVLAYRKAMKNYIPNLDYFREACQ